MVTQITLGSAYQSNGKTVLNGSQSGLDTKSLIDDLVTAKSQPATLLTATNKTLDGQLTAMTSLKTILASFQTAADTLRNQPGVGNASQTIFQYRTSTSSTNDGTSAANYVGITVQPGADIQNFSIDSIDHLAQQTKQQSNVLTLSDTSTASAVAATATAGSLSAGTFSLKATDGGTDPSITLNSGDSLQTVVNDFNQVKSRTGIQASIIQVSTGANGASNTYQLVFTGTQTGLANAFDLSSSTTVTSGSGSSGPLGGLTFTTQQLAQDAELHIDGIDIKRSSNAITDIYNGVTFNLSQTTTATGTTIATSVVPDTSIVSNAISAFADAYNKFKLFASTQQQRNADGTPTDTAVLANDPTLRSIISQVNDQVTAIVGGITNGDPSRLADVGISFDDFAGDDTNPATKNIMTVDTDALTSALNSNFNGVANLFEYNLTSDNSSLTTYARTKNVDVTNLVITINHSTNTYQASYNDASGNAQTVALTAAQIGTSQSITLTGPDGSSLEGLTLIYSSAADATIHANITQGIGDKVYNSVTGMIDDTDGTLTKAMSDITDQETRNTTEIDKINDDMVTYRDQLTQQYANLESALTKANQLLSLLQAQSDARVAAAGS